jgi:Tol biopolymer transport system component
MKLALVLAAATLAIAFGASASQADTPSPVVFSADRTPSVTGEIYRLDPNGHLVDLSKSPYQDLFPSVSPNGKQVAFFSDRSGKGQTYVVGIDGRHLHKVGPSWSGLVGGCDPTAAWQPGTTHLVINACTARTNNLWIVGAHGKTVTVRGGGVLAPQPWSPDGHVFVAYVVRNGRGAGLEAFSPSGKKLFSVPGATFFGGSAWSPTGLLAVKTKSGGAVYNESGHLLFTYQAKGDGVSAWSPDGSKLAVNTGSQLLVLSLTGATVLHKSLTGRYGAVWDGNTKVVVEGFGKCGCGTKSVDIATGTLAPASSRWFDTLSANRKLAIVPSRRKSGNYSLGAGPPAGGKLKQYATVPGCWEYDVREPAIGSQQFAGRSIIYESWGFCDPPYANLYSVDTAGGPVHRVTSISAQETQPALSPDETQIAFVLAKFTGISCAGCSDGIRVVNADGSGMTTLTNPQNCTFDDSPTWSPDQTTILYSESSCDVAGELFTIPAIGGSPHDLGIAGIEPAWGPTRIAYVGSDQSDAGLWTANPDGSDPTLVAQHGSHPAWSPAGDLAYLVGNTLVVGSSSSTLPFARVASLAWTPDGTRLVVAAAKKKTDPSLDVYTVNPDGTGLTRLTANYGVLDAGN